MWQQGGIAICIWLYYPYINVAKIKIICISTELFLLSSQKSAFHRPQTLGYKDGYALPRRPTVGIGQDPLLSEQLIQQEISEVFFEKPDIIYDSCDQRLDEVFIPAYVALDKKVRHSFEV